MPNFKMEMIPCSPTALPYSSNGLSLSYMLSKLYQVLMIVRIDSNKIGLMLQYDNTAISTWPPATENYFPPRCSLYRGPLGCDNINPIVSTRCLLFKTTRNVTLHRPN